MFREERNETKFDWKMIGDIGEGRPNLGSTTDVGVYRMMQFTLRDVLITEFDVDTADRIYFRAGAVAGREFFNNVVTRKEDFNEFVKELQTILTDLKIGILRIEMADLEKMHFILTVAEDLDCSGLPATGETICTYDEGFISGLFSAFTGQPFTAKEVDCWCSGDRVCRFEVKPDEQV